MKCLVCLQNEATGSAIVEGTYFKEVCDSCKPHSHVSSGHARWERSIDAEDHESEIIQPYGADGGINPKFAKLYPKQAKALFSDKEIRDAELK